MTVVTDLAFPRVTSPGNYLAPNPASNPVFTSTGSPINGGLGNLSFAYNNVTLQVPCVTLQNYLTLLCRNDLDDSVLVNKWGIFFRSLNATAVGAWVCAVHATASKCMALLLLVFPQIDCKSNEQLSVLGCVQ
jgi:hypothetical protein